MDHRTTTPITTSGRYSHTDGTVGEYAWVDGQPKLLRVAASHEALDITKRAEESAYEAAQIAREEAARRATP